MDEVRRDCPLTCLGLSAYSWGALRRLSRWQQDSPPTVGELLDLALTGRLDELRGIGPYRVADIKAALRRAGLLDGHDHLTAEEDHAFRPVVGDLARGLPEPVRRGTGGHVHGHPSRAASQPARLGRR